MATMDWPLSQEEKRRCALRCYAEDVQAADEELRSKDEMLRSMRREIKELRRASLCSSRASVTPKMAPGSHSPDSAGSPASPAEQAELEAPSAASPEPSLSPTAPPPPAAPQAPALDEAPQAPDEAAKAASLQEAQASPAQCSALARKMLRAALQRFYGDQPDIDVGKLVQRFSGEGVPDLWAMIALKYQMRPSIAVMWLSRSLDPVAPVQWPRGKVPEAAKLAVASLGDPAGASEGEGCQDDFTRRHSEALKGVLGAGDLDAVRALSFRGWPSPELRSRLWRSLLLDPEGAPSVVGPESDPPTEALRAQVESDAYAIWKDDPFLAVPGVLEAVVEVSLDSAASSGQHTRGTCEMAALLLYALVPDRTPESLAAAKQGVADCLARVMEEVRPVLEDDQRILFQAGRVQELLALYDPPLAQLLQAHGLASLPTTRLGAALCTRGGFSLGDCARIWDALLADPQRFRFCEYVIVALLLCSREDLLKRKDNPGGVAEALLTAPRRVRVQAMMCTAHAICAFERRCGGAAASQAAPQFPPRSAARGAERRARSAPRGGAMRGLLPHGEPAAGPEVASAAAAWAGRGLAQLGAATQSVGQSVGQSLSGLWDRARVLGSCELQGPGREPSECEPAGRPIARAGGSPERSGRQFSQLSRASSISVV